MNTMNIKNILLISLASVGGFITSLLGGWDKLLKGLCVCMVIDFATGLILAFIFHKSQKTKSGRGCSNEIFKGLAKKICILFLIALCVCVDNMTNTHYIRNTAILFFIGNEGLSIIENTGQMGVPYPEFIKKALEALKEKGENKDGKD